MYSKSAALAVFTATLSAQALSTGCTTGVASLALGDLGSCLQLTSALSLFSSSGSIVSNLNGYLGSLCASSTPTCSNSTLTSAQSTISSDCSSDISGGGTSATEIQVLETILENYPEVYAAACSKNSTTGDYCLTSTLYTIQNATGSDITISYLTGLLSGSGASSLESVASSGALCTGCVSEIYHQALKANSTIAQSSAGSAIASKCGSSFGQSDATSVSVAGVSATSSAASTASSSGAASLSTGINLGPWFLATGTFALGGVVGAAALL